MSGPQNPAATKITLHVQQSDDDLHQLANNDYELQVAKSVATDDSSDPKFNVVYQSYHLASNMSIGWEEQYALNWTQDIDAPGVDVTYGGKWTPAELGSAWSLDEVGVWSKNNNSNNAQKDALTVDANGYVMPVHIIVGIKDPKIKDRVAFTPIFVSKSQLLVQGTGHYTPKEEVQIWYEHKEQTAKMISNQRSSVENFSMTGKQEHWFRWDNKNGKWLDQDKPFNPPPMPIIAMAATQNVDFSEDGEATNGATHDHDAMVNGAKCAMRMIRLNPKLEQATINFIKAQMALKIVQILKGVKPTITAKADGSVSLTICPPSSGDLEAENVDTTSGDPIDAAIDTILNELKAEGALPSNETWTIEP